MKKKLLGILKVLLFLGLGLLLIWLSVRKLTPAQEKDIYNAVLEADYFWVIASLVLGVLSHLSRAVRWKMLMEPLGHRPTLYNTFFAVCTGYLANYAIHRLGEVTRCTVLTRYEKVPFTEGFGTVIAERIIDMFCMIIIFILTVAVQVEEISGIVDVRIWGPVKTKLAQNSTLLYIIIACFAVTVIALFLLRKKIGSLVSGKMKNLLKGFAEGLRSVRKVKNPWAFLFHTVFIWTMYYFMVYVVFFSFDQTSHLGHKAGLAVLMFGSVGIIFTPGGIGAYPLIVAEVLVSIYGITEAMGLAYGWVAWTSQFALILLLGLISFILLSVLNREKPAVKAGA